MTTITIDNDGIFIDGKLAELAQNVVIQIRPCGAECEISIIDGLERIFQNYKIGEIAIRLQGYQVAA